MAVVISANFNKLYYLGFMVSESDFYREFLSRVASLNDNQKSYRVTFIVLIGAYYTAVQFLLGAASGVVSDSNIDVAVFTFYLLTVVALAGCCIVAFFDFIAQELIEDCLRGAEKIELSSESLRSKKIFVLGNKRKNVTSLRISLTLALFYFIPIFCMYVVCWMLADSMVFGNESDVNFAMAAEICERILKPHSLVDVLRGAIESVVPLRPSAVVIRGAICDANPVFVLYTNQTVKIIGLIHIFALGLFSYFIFYSARRIAPRFVKEVVGVRFFGFFVKLFIRILSTALLAIIFIFCVISVPFFKVSERLPQSFFLCRVGSFSYLLRLFKLRLKSIWWRQYWMKRRIQEFSSVVERYIRSFMWMFIGFLWFVFFWVLFVDDQSQDSDRYARFIVRPLQTLEALVSD